MVHKIYRHRVVDYLRHRTVVDDDDDTADDVTTTLDVLDEVRGSGRARRGYHVILCRNKRPTTPIDRLSPLARQNISWMARMRYQAVTVTTPSHRDDDHDHDDDDDANLTAAVYSSLHLDLAHDVLRVDVYPRHLLEVWCGRLQQQAAVKAGPTTIRTPLSDPFEGRIRMTASRSQCTVRLTLVVTIDQTAMGDDQDSPSNGVTSTIGTKTTTACYWGVDRRPTDTVEIDLNLNHEANQELNIVPMQPNGQEPPTSDGQSSVQLHPITTPLSRAHYKLRQVNDDVLQPRGLLLSTGAAALDLGASPGGWTQLLLAASDGPVYAVDPAVMAQRVLRRRRRQHGVVHLPCMLHAFPAHWGDSASTTRPPLSTVVCDASILWSELWEALPTHILPYITRWRFPVVLVLTCKLPFRTAGSIARHVGRLRDALPGFVERLRPFFDQDVNNVMVESQLLHLFANSESERTLVLIVKKRRDASHEGVTDA